jgi:hypothetical protein
MSPQLSEKAFRTYEGVIAKVVEAYPNVVSLQPSIQGVAATTFVARLRDAMKSFHEYAWTSDINHRVFCGVYINIIVTFGKDGYVLVGPRSSISAMRSPAQTQPSVTVHTSDDGLHIAINPTFTPECLAFLAHNRALARPLIISGLAPEKADELSTHFDILLEPHSGGCYTLS